MKIDELGRIIDAEIIIQGHPGLDPETVYVSDLMSDVLTYGREAQLLVTSLINQQTIRTVEMVEIPVICYVNGKVPGSVTIDLAERKKITILATGLSAFQVCKRLADSGLKG